jgi:hypothetical protein
MGLEALLVLCALGCFVLAAGQVPSRIAFGWLGLAFWLLASVLRPGAGILPLR